MAAGEGQVGWALWHYGIFEEGSAVRASTPEMASALAKAGLKIHLLHPELLHWQVEASFALMRDAVRLGMSAKLGPGSGWGYRTFATLSSGMHALLLAIQMCDRVNAFGFTIGSDGSGDLPGAKSHGGVPQRYYGSINEIGSPSLWRNHAWRFEADALRLLALSGKVNMCSAGT